MAQWGESDEMYRSFLIRMWRVVLVETGEGSWQYEVEHIQSGRQWFFHSLDELLTFLRHVEDMGEKDDFEPHSNPK